MSEEQQGESSHDGTSEADDKNVKPLSCPICLKTFKHQGYLTRHTKTFHKEAEKKFCCSVCDQTFRLRGILKQHMRKAHDEVRNFKCSICTKGFKDNCYLQSHLSKVHGKSGEFSCSICDKAFGYQKTLMLHIFKHKETQHIYLNTKGFKDRNLKNNRTCLKAVTHKYLKVKLRYVCAKRPG